MHSTEAISYAPHSAIPSFAVSSEPVRFYPFRPGIFLVQILLCILPSTCLLASGHATLAGYCFWAGLGFLTLCDMIFGKRDELLGLLLATAPFINLFRGFIFYNIVVAVFCIAFAYYFALAPGTILEIVNRAPLATALFAYTIIYYALSFLNTHDYAVNLRLFELAFTVFFVQLLQRTPFLLGTALRAMILSAWAVGLAMLPQIGAGARLGIIRIEGQTLGNPTQLGIPLAMGFLALIVDKGRWLNLEQRPMVRWAMLLITIPLLALTTSRASWLIAAGGLFICLLGGNRQRIKMLLVIAVAIVTFQGVLLSPYGNSLKKGLDRTFSENRTTSNRTSGRSDQWRVAYHAFTRSPETILRGYGAGSSPSVYAAFSGEVPGVKYAVGKKVAFHSLFMQIAVELGAMGLSLLLAAFGIASYQIMRHQRYWHTIFPIVCFAGYIFIVITVSGNDINSGVLLGLALIGTRCPDFFRPTERSESYPTALRNSFA